MTEPARCEWVTGQQPLPALGDWLTAADVAGQLAVSTTTVYKLCRTGGLPHARVGRMIRIPRRGLWEWAQGQRVTS